MATLSGNKIKNTYQSLVKFSDNGNITTSAKQLTDGFGNNSPMFVSTTQVGIGVTPESGLNLHVFGDAKIGSNLTVIGNLIVEGSTTTVGTDTLTVKDPLIVLANNNTSTDAVDIGFYGKYTPSGTTLYSGLFREALTGKYRLFKGLETEPTTTVNTSGTGYARADLVIGDLEAERGTFTDSIFVSPSLYVSDAILHTGDIDTKLEFLSDQIKFSTGGSFRLSINNSYSEFFTNVRFEDGIKAQFGDNQDLEIYYDGTTDRAYFNSTSANQSIFAGGAESFIRVGGTQNALVANHNGNVSLNYSGATKLSTSSTGVTVEGIVASDGLDLGDNDKIRLGDSQDLEIYHNGTHSYIDNNTGDIIIRNDAADKGISFLADDGAGGSENYVYIDGGTFQTKFYKDTKHLDSVKAFFGTGNDLEIYHNGSHAYLTNDTGNFEITTTNNLILQDASSNKWMMTNQGGGVLLYYNGGTSKLTTTPTGISINGRISGLTDPTLAQDAATKAYVDTIFASSDTLAEVLSFGNETLGNSIIITTEDDVFFRDNSMAIFGNANDLSIYHDSSNSHIRNATGDLLISALEADSNIKFYTDNGTGTTVSNLEISGSTGTVSLKYYGSQKLYTTSTGVSITGRISQLTDPSAAQDAATKSYVDSQVGANNELSEVLANGNTTGSNDIEVTNGNINFEDSTNASKGRAYFGNQSDLAIYHDSTNSYIAEGGVGSLNLLTNTLNIQTFVDTVPTPRETMATFVRDGAVSLYYDNSKKFETTSTGVSVTGGGAFTDNISIVGNVKKLQWIDTQGNWKIESGNGSNKLVIHSESLVEDYLTIKGTGVIQLNDYGSGSNTGTATQKLAVDSSGNIIEIPIGGGAVDGSGTANTVTMWSDADTITDAPITISGNNATLSGIFNIGTHNAYAIKLQRGDGTYVPFAATASDYLYLYNSNASGNIRIRNAADTVSLIEITDSGNSTFAGDVIINGNGKVLDLASDNYLRLGDNQDLQIVHTYSGGDSIIDSFSGEFKIRQRAENINLTFGTYSGDAMVIDTSGNVGIGTTSPAAGFQVAKGGTTIPTAGSSTASAVFGNSTSDDNYGVAIGANFLGVGYISSQRTDGTATTYNLAIQPNGGNVGIGTASPDHKLRVNGDARLGNLHIKTSDFGTGGTGKTIYADGAGSGVLGFISTTAFDFSNGSTSRVRIDSSGNVGIGTTNPTRKFVVSNSGASGIEIQPNYTTGVNEILSFNRSSSAYEVMRLNGGSFEFQIGGNEKMHINSSGNVGIGTTSPAEKLHVQGNLRLFSGGYPYIDIGVATNNYFRLIHDNPTDTFNIQKNGGTLITVAGGGNVGIGTTSPSQTFTVENNSGIFRINTSTSTYPRIEIGSASGTTAAIINRTTATQNILFGETSDTGNYLFRGGNVGIGTTSPDEKLVVNGNILISDTSNDKYFGSNVNLILNADADGNSGSSARNIIFQNRGSEKMRIDSEGNVGIGTTTPDTNLEVESSTGGVLRLTSSNTTVLTGESIGKIEFKSNDASTGGNNVMGFIDSVATNVGTRYALSFGTGDAAAAVERMRIDNLGNVGIGTTSPAVRLDFGASLNQAFHLYTSGADYYGINMTQYDSQGYSTNIFSGNGGLIKFRTASGTSTQSTRMTITAAGNVGIGTTNPAVPLHISNTYPVIRLTDSDGASPYGQIINSAGILQLRADDGNSTANSSMQFFVDGGEKARIDSSGNVGIGTTSPTYGKITVTESGSAYTGDYIYGGTNGSYGALRCTLSASNSPSFIDFFRSSYSTTVPVGAIVTSGSNCLYQSYSDYRMKENVSELTGALDKVNNIQPKTFNYKEDTETTYQGFIAHELQEVVPQAVSGKKDEVNEDGTPKYQGVDNSHIVPLLVGAIQELKAEIELLKTQINN